MQRKAVHIYRIVSLARKQSAMRLEHVSWIQSSMKAQRKKSTDHSNSLETTEDLEEPKDKISTKKGQIEGCVLLANHKSW